MSVTITCRECGETSEENSGDLAQLVRQQLCFICDHWTKMVALHDDPRTVRIQGKQYTLGPEEAGSSANMRGFGGLSFLIRFRNGRTVSSTNLWLNGEIPRRFRGRLPDNAEFLREERRSA